ncbi:MAG: PAS domain S-box protein, partial [Bacteriovorax sp.]|nr:PAS domain S-box protein [Bacteriovorax sp.]
MRTKKVTPQKKINKNSKVKSGKTVTKQMGSLEKFRRMTTVIQDSNDAITFQDLEGNILAWNRGAEIMYGYSEAEALSKNIV